MKTETFAVGSLQIMAAVNPEYEDIAYILYPLDILRDWIEPTAQKYKVSIAVISNMNWDNDLTPWPAPGESKGCADFKGNAPEFLKTLIGNVVPKIDRRYSLPKRMERTLVGVSLSGLFTLWQWAQIDTFKNIATLSGSFWYEGFEQWVFRQSFAGKRGKCYILLGNEEPYSNIPAYRKVGRCTENIVGCLHRQGVEVIYNIVPGNHYQFALQRLNKAFGNLYDT
ncbi:MAG: alpha/beta hydrolase-fold protein [Candidatus Amulumruptor caecigallinarius]|nr:alpha/beta hydrolase-fold protein [Candidatus Amulumruptor caecigallinarius]